MKVFVFALVVLSFLLAVSAVGDVKKEDVQGCKDETKYDPSKKKADSPEGKCFRKCMLMKKNEMSSNGAINVENYRKPWRSHFGTDETRWQKFVEITDQCATEASKKTSDCDKAYAFHQCNDKKARETNIFSKNSG